MASVIDFIILSDILYIFRQYHSALQDHIVSIFVVNAHHSYISPFCFALFEDVLINV